MTVREVIIKLLDCKNMDKEFTIEVRVDAVKADEANGHTWCELGIQGITICNDIDGGAVATANGPESEDKG